MWRMPPARKGPARGMNWSLCTRPPTLRKNIKGHLQMKLARWVQFNCDLLNVTNHMAALDPSRFGCRGAEVGNSVDHTNYRVITVTGRRWSWWSFRNASDITSGPESNPTARWQHPTLSLYITCCPPPSVFGEQLSESKMDFSPSTRTSICSPGVLLFLTILDIRNASYAI